MINKFSFQFLFVLNNITSPSPAFTHKPVTNAPNDNPPKPESPVKKSSVKTTLDAQFGIKPITTASKGCNQYVLLKNLARFSSPTQI